MSPLVAGTLMLLAVGASSAAASGVSLVTLGPQRPQVHAHGEFTIGVRCPDTSPCRGTVSVRRTSGALILRRPVRARAGTTHPVTLRLDAPSRRSLARRKRLPVTLTVDRSARLRTTLEPGARFGCWPSGADPVAHGATGRVFFLSPTREADVVPYGCLYERDVARRLAGKGGVVGSSLGGATRFVGEYFASETLTNIGDPKAASFMFGAAAWDLRTGARVVTSPTFYTSPLRRTTSIVLTGTGAIAWIYGIEDPAYGTSGTVGAVDAAGERELDKGAGVKVSSLALEGQTVTWIHDGQTRSAGLQ